MRVLLYSGKGGVGKTSLSAATAVAAARHGHRTLIVSTDAAHSLADALDLELGSDPVRVAPKLWGVEVDVNRELQDHWGVIHEWLTRFMTFQGLEDSIAEEMAILPGMEELFSLLRVKRFADSGQYDVIIIDCAPTGETVRMLGFPEVLKFYFARIFPIQRSVARSVRPVAKHITEMPIPEDSVFAAVKKLHGELDGLAPLLQDPRHASIRLVLNPERMVIKESQRLLTYLSLFGFPVDAVIANRVLPPEARSPYFEHWFELQSGYLSEARQSFQPLPLLEARLFDREMVGLDRLKEFAEAVFGDDDPTRVYFKDRPMRIKKEGDGYALYLRLPFADRDKLDVWTAGDELIVSINNQRRNVALPRSVATRKLEGAAFRDGHLRIAFGKREDHAKDS